MPAFPLAQTKRAQYLFKHPELDLAGLPSNELKERCLDSLSSTMCRLSLESSKESYGNKELALEELECEIFQGQVDEGIAITQSQLYYHSLNNVVNYSSIVLVPRLSHVESKYSFISSISKSVSSKSLGLSTNYSTSSYVSLRVEISSTTINTEPSWYQVQALDPYHGKAELSVVRIPSPTKIIAPDGKQ